MASRHHNGGSWITRQRRLALYIRDGFECAYCGRDMRRDAPSNVTLDHLLSRDEYAALSTTVQARFGSVNASANLVTACKPCNSSRGNTPWEQYADADARARILTRTSDVVNLELATAIIAGTVGDPRVEE